jgi:branched-chain amino acid transport system substrate-binding protein
MRRPALFSAVALVALLPSWARRAVGEDAPAAPVAPAPGGAYGETPDALVPHRGAGEPARRFFQEAPTYRGPGADDAEPADAKEVPLAVIVPMSGIDAPIGRRMRNGYALAIEEANAAGGLRPGVPFRLLEADENDTWGAAGNALVDLATRQGCYAVLGALDDQNSHVMTRVLLKINTPMVNTGGTDPTLTEHMIPWLVRVRPDDRQAAYRLATRIVSTDRRERVAFFRANDRYARAGIGELADALRRLGHPVALEVRYGPDDRDFGRSVEALRQVKPDAIVMWGRPAPTGRALAALRAGGIDVPVYGSDRLVDPEFLAAAGAAAEGLLVETPLDPTRTDPAWDAFRARYRAKFGADPDHHAAYAYDGASMLVAAVRKAGLNRVRIRAALYDMPTWTGVTGPVAFDITHNNVAPGVLARVEGGVFRFGVR